ncbi:glycosyltransferase family 4 protein [Bradyrhizobium sp. WSM1417]|uniref:glycosyltransferase family 4 protein n=1 Tax=Bradyrhizobium sp. WSM1417 TaxID=754500 RepID=UPI0018DE43B0|nr:glycosyltransferase [Bradyrhizobium sp. WSM1417]
MDRLEDETIAMENRPKPLRNRGGLLFHLSQILYGAYLAFRAARFGADVAIIDSGSTHYFVLMLFRALRIPVAVNLHNVLWPAGFPPAGPVPRIIRALNRLFFRFAAAGAIGVSPECERQVVSESRYRTPFFQYRCQFRPDGFRQALPYEAGPFRIVFVGRAERNKGVLDIAQMAAKLEAVAPVKVVFEICGDGPALPELRTIIEQERLGDLINVHGRLERDALLGVYAASHAAIVPTRSDFTEGMPQVCAEAVLSGLPVITSQVANAFDVIGPATIRAETDDVGSYVKAIVALIESAALRSQIWAECQSLSLQFLDRSQSYPAAVDRLLGAVFGSGPISGYAMLFGETETNRQ